MKRIVFVFPLAMMLAVTLSAQDALPELPSAEEKAEKLTDRMSEHLELNDVQAEQVYQMNLESAQQMEPYMQALRNAREVLHTERKEQETARATALASVLTPEQLAKLETLKSDRKKRMAERRERCKRLIKRDSPRAPTE